MIDIKYGQTIITKGYYDGLVTIKEQTREDIKTTQNTLLADVISCLDVLKTDTPELIIRIMKDKYGSVNIIQKTWTTDKKKVK